MRNKSTLFLLVFCLPSLISGLDTGIGLQTRITKAANASSLALGPVISFDWRQKDIELSMEIYSAVLIGSALGLNLKVYHVPPFSFWQPRIGVGTGCSLNNRIMYASSLNDFSVPPLFSWNAVVSLELFRFMFRRAGISFLSMDLFTNLNGQTHEIGGAVTLFRFMSRRAYERM